MLHSECKPGLRVVITSLKHRGKYAIIIRPLPAMVKIQIEGDTTTRNIWAETRSTHPTNE